VGEIAALGAVRDGLEWIAQVEVTPGTHLLGESWVVRGGRVTTVVSQPHIWEMTLFAMAALEAWGPIDVVDSTRVEATRSTATPSASAGSTHRLPATGGGPPAGAALVLAGAGLGGLIRGRRCRRLLVGHAVDAGLRQSRLAQT
jgi:hypothetical protein